MLKAGGLIGDKMFVKVCPVCGKRFETAESKVKCCSRKCSDIRGYRPRKSIAERFWKKVTIQGPDDCWVWSTPSGRYGYLGEGGLSRKNILAHRVSWELHYGLIPDGLQVLHRCDNPKCVNPRHLFLGTISLNMQDRNRKKRQAWGENHGRAKLQEKDILAIYALRGKKTHREIGKLFNVSSGHISRILSGEKWHLLKERVSK
jgi:hypothetical protein